ncbi:MAG TPA: YdeI/OmpD-associated family protein [Bacteroidia bacterium]|nr:YdeI/OmpD-associated family protein [Bacteroidia bacterium]
MQSYSAKIFIIGVNPYVLVPNAVLKAIFKQAGKEKGAIPIRGRLDGHPYIQTLVRYSGKWRLYLNTPMRKAAKKDVGDTIKVEIEFDPVERIISIHPDFLKALNANKTAKKTFEGLPPSRQKEIVRYIGSLKSEEARDKNISRAIGFLSGKGRFVGRDKP